MFHTFHRHFIGFLSTHLCYICIGCYLLTIDDKECNECNTRYQIKQPIRQRTEEEITFGRQSNIILLDKTNILIQYFQLFLACKVCNGLSCITCSLFHMQFILFRSQHFIRTGINIKITELYGRNLISSRITGNCQILNDLTTGEARICQTEFIVHLRIIYLKILGEFDFRIREQLQIAGTRDDKFDSNGIIGLDICTIDRRSYIELSHSSRKIGWLTCRQGLYVNCQLRSQNCLFNFYVIASSIEKCLERISNLCSLCNGSIKACSINCQLTGLLREQHKLTIDCRLIISTFIMLQSPSSVIRQFYFLRMESFEVRQFHIIKHT